MPEPALDHRSDRNDVPLVSVREVCKYFPDKLGPFQSTDKRVRALDGVSFDIYPDETLGLVGESGCGKSTLARTIVGLHPPTSGSIAYRDQDITNLSRQEKKELCSKIQFIFQDPSASLNPRRTIAEILATPFIIHRMYKHRERAEQVKRLIKAVGLDLYHLNRYPHELSGGQKQRVGIARALALNPEVVICDEPVSALDVSIQAQVINLLEELQQEFQLTYLFISHDLSVVYHVSERVLVMYLGKVVEMAKYHELYSMPLHPYTKALLTANPSIGREATAERTILRGDLPGKSATLQGCRFHPRCPRAFERCRVEEPVLEDKCTDHRVSCHLYECGISDKSLLKKIAIDR